MHAAEKVLRRVAYVVIGLFVAALFGVLVIPTLVEAVRRNPRAAMGLFLEPGCLMIVTGPVLAWVALMVIYFRTPRAERARRIGTFGRRGLNFGAIMDIFRAYARTHGRDIWPILFLLSGTWTIVLLWLLAPEMSEDSSDGMIWASIMTIIWIAFAVATWRATGATRKKEIDRKRWRV